MVRSMFAGVAGLRTHQAKMDVIGNNIANVNTWGFKSGSMSFKDTMYQNTSSGSKGSTAAGSYGGSNANQVGYGVTTGSISYDFSMGSPSPSSRSLDCMIDGSGFFIVGPMINGETLPLEGETTIGESGLYLSRVGKFDVDNQGYLVDDAGNYVYGFTLNDDGTYNTAALAPLRIPTNAQMDDINSGKLTDAIAEAQQRLDEAKALKNSLAATLGVARQEYTAANNAYKAKLDTYSGISDDDGDPVKYSELDELLNDKKTAMDKAYAEWDKDQTDAKRTAYNDAKLEYDRLNHEVIKAKAVLSADGALKTYSGFNAAVKSTWEAYDTALNAYKADPADPTLESALNSAQAALEAHIGGDSSLEAFKTALDAYKADPADPTLESALNSAQAALADHINDDSSWETYEAAWNAYKGLVSGDLDYDTKKKAFDDAKAALETAQAKLLKVETGSLQGQNDAKKLEMSKTDAKVTLAETTVTNAENALKAANDAAGNRTESSSQSSSDSPAKMTNYKIQKDGTVVGTSEDGSSTVIIGKIALAGVQNTSGLEKTTGYYYVPGANAGNIGVYEAGGPQGEIMGNYLEMAKVDLATEMTDMITTQRGFQANSKIITVTDQMLEELVNIKR